jgi:hypothetical protein
MVTVKNTGITDGRYSLTLQVSEVSVEQSAGANRRRPTGVTVVVPSGLLTRKQDYLETLGVVTAEIVAAATGLSGSLDDRAEMIADWEDKLRRCLAAMAAEVSADRLLLSAERTDLTNAIASRERYCLAALATAIRLDERFREVSLDTRFRPYLQAMPLLMEAAGAKIVRLVDGRTLVLAVGLCQIKDKTVAGFMQARTVARAKAEAAVVGELAGVEVWREDSVVERTVIRQANATEQAEAQSEVVTRIRSRTHGKVRGLSLAGQWKSADGELVFVALGGFFGRDGLPISMFGR